MVFVILITPLILLKDHSAHGALRPFYNMAHMINSIPEIGPALDQGANVIETDITFSSNGTPAWTYHGYPCDCFRKCDNKERLPTFLQHIKEITTPGNAEFRSQLVLIYFDLKIDKLDSDVKAVAGKTLASMLVDTLWTEDPKPQVYVLLSLERPDNAQFVTGAQQVFSEQLSGDFIQKMIGWDVGLYGNLEEVNDLWSSLQMTHNLWLGSGSTNCLRFLMSDSGLKDVIEEFDCNDQYAKVYDWTVDPASILDKDLRLGVDGIITNRPERLTTKLQEFSDKVRLATITDSPWERFQPGECTRDS